MNRRHSTTLPRQLAMTDSAIYVTRPASARPRHPPSSFFFPFQAYPGNPDPGTFIPGTTTTMLSRRRSSLSSSDFYHDLHRPYAPFMAESSSSPHHRGLPRSSSTHSFRAPFLSPASRPSSSLWSPPTYSSSHHHPTTSPSESQLALPLQALKSRVPLPSTRLPQKLSPSDKPWLNQPDIGARLSWWLTFSCIILGLAGAGFLCYLGTTEAPILKPSQLCLVMDESFAGGDSLDDTTWSPEVQLGGFGNGEFQMTTTSPTNLHITNQKLYLTPTLTSVDLPDVDIFGTNGGGKNGSTTYTIPDCTESSNNKTACIATANPSLGTVINPALGARINTQGKKEIKYGRVEIRAKLPVGDWLWPTLTLLPSSPAYLPSFPASGLITLLSSRGNSPSTYIFPQKQGATQGGGNNFIFSSLSYAPLSSLYFQIFSWFGTKRRSFAQEYHTYVLEWDQEWMRVYVDTRLDAVLEVMNIKPGRGFWERAGFPLTAQNGTSKVVVQNPYANASANAPFDQSFYLTISLAIGGTSGWFPDNVGEKPWYDGSLTAMRDFAKAQDTWSQTWSDNIDERSFIIDYVKMWEKC